MDLIQSDQTNAPVEAEPRYVPATASLPIEKTEHGQAWIRLVATILGALILIVLIVFLARWIYHASHHKATVTPATSQNTAAKSSSNTSSQAPASSAANPSSPQTSSGAASSSGTASTPAATNNQISNTGPGNVVAIFAGSSLAAAGLHYIISLRRFSKNRA